MLSTTQSVTEPTEVTLKKVEEIEKENDEETPYSIFTSYDRLVLIVILSLIGFWSTISSPIYFPALPTLTSYFHTSSSIMNISVVAYLIFQGIAPTISSNLADTFGRRPVILASIIVFCASCVAISQTNVYWLLAVLRCIQAAGIAAVISISSGVAGDVCTRANRGSMVGAVAGLQLVGNGIGGLVGAALISSFNSWRSVFIFLTIGGGVTFILAIFILPETSRKLVGNGSVVPKNILNKSPYIYLPHFKKRMNNDITTIVPATRFIRSFENFFPKKCLLHTITCGNTFCSMDDGFDFIVY